MRAIQYHEQGEPNVLRVETVADPSPRSEEVVVEARAIGVNPTETYTRAGDGSVALPRTPGADVAGVVHAVGDGVAAYSVGDRVFATGLQTTRQGSYAEYVPVPVANLAPLSPAVTFAEGAGIGVVGVTAWRGLVECTRPGPGGWCLIHGGSGGVGHVAVQLAAEMGLDVIATAADRVHDRVEAFGADVVLSYDHPHLQTAVRAAADGGVEVVLDHRVGEYLQTDVDVAANGATVLGIGGPNDACELEELWTALTKDVTVRFLSMSNTPDLHGVLERLGALLAADQLEVAVAREYDLADAAAAQRALRDERFVGKLLLWP
jgi:NADPH:quinone reductase-like Zn-dependent oxidoreductase